MTIRTIIEYGSLEAEQRALWEPFYQRTLNILGTSGIIIPMGDPNPRRSPYWTWLR